MPTSRSLQDSIMGSRFGGQQLAERDACFDAAGKTASRSRKPNEESGW